MVRVDSSSHLGSLLLSGMVYPKLSQKREMLKRSEEKRIGMSGAFRNAQQNKKWAEESQDGILLLLPLLLV